jgi:hypothetical protein
MSLWKVLFTIPCSVALVGCSLFSSVTGNNGECYNNGKLGYKHCASGNFCDTSKNTCHANFSLDEGDDCGAVMYTGADSGQTVAACKPDLICQPYDLKCRKPGGDNAVCTENSHCQSGLTCNGGFVVESKDYIGKFKRCKPLQPLDAPCGIDSDCQEGLACLHEGRTAAPYSCRHPAKLGEKCYLDKRQCEADLVCNYGLEPSVCDKPASRGKGEPCGRDESCLLGLGCKLRKCE